ncbi:MAG: AraC family ligand binding domain-containing protein, partial [Trichococcus sp.]|uniref:AraC family ligand binding domain-containing protein n=1 Tax=Trichococcus sp. TaxID=1985464 RepID=UPI003C5413D1
MRMIFDNEYEDLKASVIRRTDPNKHCLLVEQSGTNLSQSIIETHWHEWLEVTYIIEGSMQVQFPNGQLEVNEGQVALIGMQTLHKITGDTGKYHFKCLHINFGLISQYVNPSVLMDKVVLIKNTEYFIKVLENIDALMDLDNVVSNIRYQSNLLELLAISVEEVENASEMDSPRGPIDFFSKILFYLGEHYQ